MSKTLTANLNPALNLDSLEAPVAGQLARAAELESALQQLLDNDAALAGMINAGAGGKPEVLEFVAAFEGCQEGVRQEVTIDAPAVGLLCAIKGHGGRVGVYSAHGVPDDPNRAIYTPPHPDTLPIADVGLGLYGGYVALDRPLTYGVKGGGLLVSLTPWNGYAEAWITLYILPLGAWGIKGQPI